jgi:polyhydroxybutyrate depolymerase
MSGRLALLFSLVALTGAPAAADTCGSDIACTLPEGAYFAALPKGTPAGAVVFLHGWGGSAKAEIGNPRVAGPLVARGYAVIAPVGLPYSDAEPTTSWNAELDPRSRDDVAFIDAVTDDAARRFGFPRENVLAAGFSLGGMMVWRLACDAPAGHAAFAPVAGTFWEPLPETCRAPVRLLHVHGWTDRMVPLEGRPIPGTDFVQGDVFAALSVARRSSRCTAQAVFETMGDFDIRSWTDCADTAGIAVALHRGGHTVPKGWADFALDWFEGRAPPMAVACRDARAAGATC